jgi:peptide/nickel transport system permease protein
MKPWVRALGRLAWALAVVWMVVTIAFVIDDVLPSDPARMVAGPQAKAVEVARVRAQLGLDRPLPQRYALYLSRLVHVGGSDPKAHATCATLGPLHVDLGRSYVQHRAVVDVIADRLPRSAWLALAALVVQTLIGVSLGTLAAARGGTRWDRGTIAATLAVASVPTFLIGLSLQFVFAVRLGWLPLDGFGATFGEHVASIVLPALALGLSGAAFTTRLSRDEVTQALGEEFARTAWAKGSSRSRVLVVHALRSALAPLGTAAALDLGALVGGAIVVEALFRWPGLGAASVNAMLDRDGPVVLGTVIVTSSAVVLANLVVDLAYGWLDPRLRR